MKFAKYCLIFNALFMNVAVASGGGDVHVPIYAVIPFVLILLCIAVLPLINGHWWHSNYPKVALFFAITMGIYDYTVSPERLGHVAIEYIAFIVLLGALFVISGGILLKGTLVGKPLTNTIILIIGSLLASAIGTTGASMLLIRPLIKANKDRKHTTHIFIFFIFMVSNIGGSLTPLGDPPLFLGFLQGVDFFWTFKLIPEWGFTLGVLTVLFFIIDTIQSKKDGDFTPKGTIEKFKVVGKINFLFLLGVIATVVSYKTVKNAFPHFHFAGDIFQVGSMSLMAFLSLKFSNPKYREANEFAWEPIREVALLFSGIFACMIPALILLEAEGSKLGVTSPAQFFWFTGILSSFLDNAPTYLTFLSLAKTLPPDGTMVQLLTGEVAEHILVGISLGAVFMGANSYIGNGPNFMVKSIVESSGTKMPSFFGYMLWSFVILIPIFVLVNLIFI